MSAIAPAWPSYGRDSRGLNGGRTESIRKNDYFVSATLSVTISPKRDATRSGSRRLVFDKPGIKLLFYGRYILPLHRKRA